MAYVPRNSLMELLRTWFGVKFLWGNVALVIGDVLWFCNQEVIPSRSYLQVG
jgi:hypothetical protein